MLEPGSEYPDRDILERAAKAEKQQRPFEYEGAGVEYEDVIEYFDFDDFGATPLVMVPNRLKQLNKNGYLEKVYPNRSETNNAYRLTPEGWDAVDVKPP